MSYPSYHHGAPGMAQHPTCWLAASKLPATPPNQCSEGFKASRRKSLSPPRTAVPVGRPSLSLDCHAEVASHTPALSYTSSSTGSRSSTILSVPTQAESSFAWQHSSSPEHLPPSHADSVSPSRLLTRTHGLRAIDADLQHELARKKLAASIGSQDHMTDGDGVSAHPRIVRASTDRRPGFVEGLVDVSEIAITSIWSNAAAEAAQVVSDDGQVLPLRWFIKETLRRSRTSCSTLQLALFYLHKARMRIRDRVVTAERAKAELAKIAAVEAYPTPPASPHTQETNQSDAQRAADLLAASRDPICCGRRMFLASLVCASKFLQDRNYSSRAWSKISGLGVNEINANERAMLQVIDYELYVRADLFANWTQRLEALACDYARQHGIDYSKTMEGPPSPVSPATSQVTPLPAPLTRSMSEYAPAPAPLSGDMRAPLPTPVLPSAIAHPVAPASVKRCDSEHMLDSCASQSRRSMASLGTQQESVLSGWLASQHHDNLVH